MVYDRSNGGGCPYCSGKRVLIGYNDLANSNPNLSAQWHPVKNGSLTPLDVTCGSDKKVWWRCENNHEWQATISSRNSGNGCPYCAGQRVISGQNDLATINPELADEWHPVKNNGLTPTDVMSGSNSKVWWLGKCGHEWEAVISSRKAGRGCPYCAGQKLLVGFNDLATKNPRLAAEWHPTKNGLLRPEDVLPGSNKVVWWICQKGHEWQNMINTRNRGNNCPYCANQIVLPGFNDLATINPTLAAQWHPTKNQDITQKDVMPGSNKKAWWICENGHEWQAVIASRNKGVGCQECYNIRRGRKKK
jgi:DNA-directed RNA polymerase subunit RPC12/RpoP